ncbi:LIC_12708 family protein [Salinispira pacifica]
MKTRALRLPLLSVLAVVLAGLSLLSCQNPQVVNIQREELFSLDIGKMEDQLDLFQVPGAPMSRSTTLAMRDGIFYIANGSANKVMEFTSYGDLISLYYNPEENPEPVLLQADSSQGKVANRRAFPYYFNQISQIAVTRDKYLLVEDRLPEERAVFDKNLGVLLDRVVLRFDDKGHLVDFLGQEGVGGTPFPYIEKIYVTRSDDIVVVARTLDSWNVYWFSPKGTLRYNVTISLDQLPVPRNEQVIPTLETVVPDQDQKRVYLKLNYYHQSLDVTTGARVGMQHVFSRVYWINLETGRYAKDYVQVPENTQRVGGGNIFGRQNVTYQYQLMGSAPGQHLIFLSQEDNNREQLLIMNTSGRVVRRRYITVEDSDLVYKTFALSPEGILCALLVWDNKAKVVWWRTDKLFDREGS